MRGPVSPDAVLARHPDPYSAHQATMMLRGGDLGEDAQAWNDAITTNEGPDRVLKVSRSTFVQLGGDLRMTGPDFAINEPDGSRSIHMPAEFDTYAGPAEKLVGHLRELVADTKPGQAVHFKGNVLPIGRVILTSMLRELDPEEIMQNIGDGLIGFDETVQQSPDQPKNYRFVSDKNAAASKLLCVKLAPLEFYFDEEQLFESTDATIGILHEGRQRLERYADSESRRPDDRLPDFVLGGIRISPGPLHLRVEGRTRIDELASESFGQIYGGQFIDGGRIAGIGRHLKDYNRHRQVELRRLTGLETSQPEQTFGNTWIGVRVYQPKQLGDQGATPRNWLRLSAEERRRLHVNGISTLQALNTGDPAVHEALLEPVQNDDLAAVILKRSGGTIVRRRRSKDQTERAILRSLKEFPDGLPPELGHLAAAHQDLGEAGDRTNLLITKEMDVSRIANYVERRGVSAFLFNHTETGEIMDINDMTTLAELVRNGIGIAKVEDGYYREFHPSGLWVKRGVAEELGRRKMALAVFGANRPEVGDAYRPDIDWFLDQLMAEFNGPTGLSVVHGGGNGVMLAAHLSARERGIRSVAASISSEKREVANLATDADAIIAVIGAQLLIRQAVLGYTNIISLFLPGGHGTFLEIYNETTQRKLLHRLPTPCIILDDDNFYRGTEQQLKDITDVTAIHRNGRRYNIGGRPDSPRHWIKNLMYFVPDIKAGWVHTKRFLDDPGAEWARANITPEQIRLAYKHERALANENAISIPPFLNKAAQDYIAGNRLA